MYTAVVPAQHRAEDGRFTKLERARPRSCACASAPMVRTTFPSRRVAACAVAVLAAARVGRERIERARDDSAERADAEAAREREAKDGHREQRAREDGERRREALDDVVGVPVHAYMPCTRHTHEDAHAIHMRMHMPYT